MTLSMSLGIAIGVRRTLWMMLGELAGIALVGTSAALGVAVLLFNSPALFAALKWVGAAYLFYVGWQTWRSEAKRPEELAGRERRTRGSLVLQGFVAAGANPKAWAFMVALLPPFIDPVRPLVPQLLALLSIMLTIELTCLLIYAAGGRILSEQLHKRGKARWLNYIAGSLMVGVGIWLALG
jgi:homoserine/homoserine lactone efflux protein